MGLHCRFKNVDSLQLLCLENVARNMNKVWTLDYRMNHGNESNRYIIGPFEELPPDLIAQLLELTTGNSRLSKVCLQLLITTHLKKVVLYHWGKIVTNEIMDLILFRCRNLTVFDISHCKRVTSKKIIEIIKSFGSTLQKIDLSHTNCDDTVTKSISIFCKHLITLNLHNLSVSYEGVKYLFLNANDQPTSVSETLKYLYLDICDFNNSMELLVKILTQWSSSIRVLQHACLWESVFAIQKNYPFKILNLTDSCGIPLVLEDDNTHTVNSLQLLGVTLPCLEHLEIRSLRGDFQLTTAIRSLGNNLSSLRIDGVISIAQVKCVGETCRNLKTLGLHLHEFCSEISENIQSIRLGPQTQAKKPWEQLQNLTVHFPEESDWCSTFFGCIEQVCLSSSLTKLVLLHCNDENLSNVLCNCVLDGVFDALEFLHLHGSKTLEANVIDLLLRENLSLGCIWYEKCQKITMQDYQQFSKYVKENKLNIEQMYS